VADQPLTTDRSLVVLCPQATAVSLNLPARLPLKQWLQIGEALARAHGRLQWYVGDWWSLEHKYGDRYEFARDLPLAPHTCETYASVCRAFAESSRRMERLSFHTIRSSPGRTRSSLTNSSPGASSLASRARPGSLPRSSPNGSGSRRPHPVG
jgi:hypothetical protein